MHPEIIELIRTALVNGTLSDIEKNIILNKASKLGIDKNEVGILIEAQQHLREQELAEKETKCTSCGNRLAGLAKVCVCGYVIDSGLTDESKSLQKALEDLENLILRVRSFQKSEGKEVLDLLSAKVDKEIRYIKTRYADNQEVKSLLAELQDVSKQHLQNAYKKKKRTQFLYLSFFFLILSGGTLSAYIYLNKKTDAERFTEKVMKKYGDEYELYKKSEKYKSDSAEYKRYMYYRRLYFNPLTPISVADSIEQLMKSKIFNGRNISEFYFCFNAKKLLDAKDTMNAKKYIDTGLVLNPNFSPFYQQLALQTPDSRKAIQYLSTAINLEPDSFAIVYFPHRCNMYYDLEEYISARNDIERYLNNLPSFIAKDLSWYIHKIQIMIKMGDKKEACIEYAKLTEEEIYLLSLKLPRYKSFIEKNCAD